MVSSMLANRRFRSPLQGLALLIGAATILSGCTDPIDPPPESQSHSPAPAPAFTPEPAEPAPEIPEAPHTPDSPGTPAPGTSPIDGIRSALNQLEIKGRAPKTGYARDEFGQRWSDDISAEFGHNGCDTRNDILNRDLINKEYKPNTRDCVVLSGQLLDPYTGTMIEFQRGRDTSSAVQIDHVVALSDAWQKGAQQLSPEVRQDFANDPLNLLAVDGPANQQKRDSDAASWVPANKPFRCQYVARQVAVKQKYNLWVTQAESDAIDHWLSTCTPEDEPALAALTLN
ncbi:calcium-binding protein [Corynebacterium sp. HMSC11H10]|nr:calcium-binding protein [Corynebacterium sp. HMSC11H10]